MYAFDQVKLMRFLDPTVSDSVVDLNLEVCYYTPTLFMSNSLCITDAP